MRENADDDDRNIWRIAEIPTKTPISTSSWSEAVRRGPNLLICRAAPIRRGPQRAVGKVQIRSDREDLGQLRSLDLTGGSLEIRDEVLGPIIIRVASFFPFHATYWLNGHPCMEHELNRKQIGFCKNDNAFLATDDVAALQAAAAIQPALHCPWSS
jgi:hypothetical protein